MNSTRLKQLGKIHFRISTAFLIGCSCLLSASAQSVLVPPPSAKPLPEEPIVEKSGDTNQTSNGSVGGSSGSAGESHLNNPFQWGGIVLHPGISYGLTYGTGLQSQPGV